MNPKWVAAAILAFVVITTFVLQGRPPSLDGKKAVEQKTEMSMYRLGEEVDGELQVKDRETGRVGRYLVRDNQLYIADEATEKQFESALTRNYYAFDWGFDIGAWSGPAVHTRLDAGVRYSPARLLYGTIAPDVLLSGHSYGLGMSLYPPPQYAGRYWRHLGVGVGRLTDFGDGAIYNTFYLSFSTR
jgi:hypothetical protein